MPGTVKSGLLADTVRLCKCDSQEIDCWTLILTLDRGHFITDLRFTMDGPEVRHSGSFDILVHFLCKKRTLQTYDSIISMNYRLTEHPGDSSDRKGLITCMEKVQHLEGDIK